MTKIRKISAAFMALGMVITAFAVLTSAQPSHTFMTTTDGATGNIGNAGDGTDPEDGLARHYIRTRPGEVAFGPTVPNPPTDHCVIGDIMDHYAQVDSEGFASPSVNGDPVIMIIEHDENATLTADGQISADGTVPKGYVASPPELAFNWPGDPQWLGASTLTAIPTTTFTPATSVDWVAIGIPNVYGYGVLESNNVADNNGPWTERGQSTGTTLAYAPVANHYYCLVIYWRGTDTGFANTQAVRGLVWGMPQLYIVPLADTATITATNPAIGTPTTNTTPQVTYTHTGSPASVDLYYWNGAVWTFWETDNSPGTSPRTFQTTAALPEGTNGLMAKSPSEPAPSGAGSIEVTPYTVDLTAPTITSTNPSNNTAGCSPAAGTYTIDFSEAMDQSVTAVSTTLPNPTPSWFDADTLQITYTALTETTTYYVNLTGQGHKDLAGLALTSNMDMLFITGEYPTITSATPADGATGVSTAVGTYFIDFSEDMNTGTTAVSSNLPGATPTWPDANTLQIAYTALAESTLYYVNLTGHGYVDLAGWALTGDMNKSFTTGDFTNPMITSTNPSNNTAGCSLAAGTYTIDFSEAMDQSVTAVSTTLPNPTPSWFDADTLQITYTALTETTTYYVNLTGQGHKDLAGLALTGSMDKLFITGEYPTITSATPADGATGVSTAAGNYLIDFSEDMNTGTTAVSSNLPGATPTWPDANTLQIAYTALAESTLYYVNLTGHGYVDLAGWALTGDMNKSFTTGDFTNPTATSTPADGSSGIALNLGTYTITFSEPMQAVGTLATDDLPAGSGWSWTDTTHYVKTGLPNLAESTTYHVVLNNNFLDVAGNPVTGDITWNFTTGDFTNPTIVSSIPADSATGVSLTAGNLTIEFSEEMKQQPPTTFPTTNIPGIDWMSAAWNAEGTNITVPYGTLAENTQYYCNFTGVDVVDLADNALVGANITFTTGGFPTITSTTPADGATGLGIAAGTYLMNFSESMNQSITTVLTDLPGATQYWADTDTLQINYTALAEYTTYYINLTGQGHMDLDGWTLTGDMYKEFTTGDFTDPIIALNSPDNGSRIMPGTALDFMVTDAHLDTVNYSVNGAAAQNFATPYDINTTGWSDGRYTIIVSARDAAGNAATANFNFTVDGTPPTIVSIVPVNGAVGVALDTTIAITFSESMSNVSVQGNLTISPSIANLGFSWNANNTILTITPPAGLSQNTAYTITIGTGAEDLVGNNLAATTSTMFTTLVDSDGDGTPDGTDTDDDGDGFLDIWEEFLGTSTTDPTDKPTDTDGDGNPDGDAGNTEAWMDTDDDGDGVLDADDPAPLDSNVTKAGGIGEYWWVILIIVIVLVLVLLFWMKRRSSAKPEAPEEVEKAPSEEETTSEEDTGTSG